MLVTIRLFARLREIAGASELQRTLPDGATARTAWDVLVGEFPQLGDYAAAVSCAVNEEYARLTATLKEGDEVAFLPPVSGGSGERVRLTASAKATAVRRSNAKAEAWAKAEAGHYRDV